MIKQEAVLAEAFVALADLQPGTATECEYLHQAAATCARALGVDLAATLHASPEGRLHPTAPLPNAAAGLLAAACYDSPAAEAFHTGCAVSPLTLTSLAPRWAAFATTARTAGYRTVPAVPVRHGNQVLGSVLLCTKAASLPEVEVRRAQSLAQAAALGVLARRGLAERAEAIAQLLRTLRNQVLIDQAAGMLAALHGTSPDEAATWLRAHARSHRRPSADIAAHVLAYQALPTGQEEVDASHPEASR
ncbi:ANTAR domain-containing protein [Streptomyces sp. NPDC006733]|uniref:ANTAR domain-containing protein n=1 Tax=Streptomyces sp. NPDC006733 TaxID=3155460 RepID=UPI0033CFA041